MKHTRASGRRKQRRGLAIAVIAVLLVLAGVAGGVLYWAAQQKKSVATTAAPEKANASFMLDTRSVATKTAAQTASRQAASGDATAAASTLNDAIAAITDKDEKISLYLQLGSTYANAGKESEAVAADQAALQINPKDWQIYENLGSVYETLGDIPNAKANYQKADDVLQGTPDYKTYHNELQGLIKNAGSKS